MNFSGTFIDTKIVCTHTTIDGTEAWIVKLIDLPTDQHKILTLTGAELGATMALLFSGTTDLTAATIVELYELATPKMTGDPRFNLLP